MHSLVTDPIVRIDLIVLIVRDQVDMVAIAVMKAIKVMKVTVIMVAIVITVIITVTLPTLMLDHILNSHARTLGTTINETVQAIGY